MEINKNISENLKRLRGYNQLTLIDLAEQSGVSKTMLGEIERGNANPSISTLCKIAEALKVPLTGLIEECASRYSLSRVKERELISEDKGYRVEAVFSFSRSIEVFNLKIKPGGSIENDGHRTGVDEYVFVLCGSVEVRFGADVVKMSSGDGLKFSADIAHGLYNRGRSVVEILNIHEYGA